MVKLAIRLKVVAGPERTLSAATLTRAHEPGCWLRKVINSVVIQPVCPLRREICTQPACSESTGKTVPLLTVAIRWCEIAGPLRTLRTATLTVAVRRVTALTGRLVPGMKVRSRSIINETGRSFFTKHHPLQHYFWKRCQLPPLFYHGATGFAMANISHFSRLPENQAKFCKTLTGVNCTFIM